MVGGHVLLAASGLGAWVGYLIVDRDMLAWIALATLGVAVPAYLAGVPLLGAIGAAIASSVAYGVHAFLTRRSLNRQPEHRLVEQAA